ncbi:uncharacterized protein EI97DRAFT_432167 [Westerdykella ornata]|uniref:Mur ligase n=1 Tax=Westerdykella ornata TaxID=318751 RepID=A0A6A6JPB3_WESOR|nr:uncharacterized protein EI97DRAFT_432167 [Westerdykella ornata]KAF2278085.1 hypothetical protein EI97DRAFT_432167 [Westerdykella ornata]
MGGLLDATNILENQVVSVITKIAHDHQTFLGRTLQEIAHHKAGILRPNVPYIVSALNEVQVQVVIDEVAQEIRAGPRLDVKRELTKELPTRLELRDWEKFAHKLPLAQREAIEMAWIAVRHALLSHGVSTTPLLGLLHRLRPLQLPGRYQKIPVPAVFGSSDRKILVDGAHNEDAAKALAVHVNRMTRHEIFTSGTTVSHPPACGRPITWVIAMSFSTDKDPRSFLRHILRPGDRLVLTAFNPVAGMPWVKPVPPDDLLQAAKDVMGDDVIAVTVPEQSVHRALMAAKYLSKEESGVVLTGSLYLVGDYFREERRYQRGDETSLELMERMDEQERQRINYWLSRLGAEEGRTAKEQEGRTEGEEEGRGAREEKYRQLLEEVAELDRQLKELAEKEEQLRREVDLAEAEADTEDLSRPPLEKDTEERGRRKEQSRQSSEQQELRRGSNNPYTRATQRTLAPTTVQVEDGEGSRSFKIRKHFASAGTRRSSQGKAA